MIVFYLVLAEASDPQRLRRIHRAFVLGCLLVVARGVGRLTFRHFYQHSWFDVFHLMEHGDLMFVTFASFYCLARLAFPRKGNGAGRGP